MAILGDEQHLLGDRAWLEGRFKTALKDAFLVFQPIVSLARGRVVAHEALLRTAEPTLKNPQAFLSAAERLGREHELGRSVREMASIAAASLPAEQDLYVNLHPRELLDPELLDAGAPLSACAARVVLELTERAAFDDLADVNARVGQLRALGFRIAIDDLGAGYAGLTSLAALQPQIVKVDMSLIRGIASDDRRQRVVGSLVELSHALSIDVVLEGVETTDERNALRALGGDVMQGYLFGRPAEKFTQLAAVSALTPTERA